MKARRLATVFGAVLCLAAAGDPAERMADPAKEARARVLFRETRCLVCQSESIDESEAPLAADLRRVIRQRLAAGASDDQVRAFLATRYGDYVLFRPKLSWDNAALWSAPFLVVLAGAALLFRRRRSGAAEEASLTAEEERRLATLIGEGDTLTPDLRSKNARGLTER
jgi:cytochrome c-type biogenesis protein CcmH